MILPIPEDQPMKADVLHMMQHCKNHFLMLKYFGWQSRYLIVDATVVCNG